MPSFYAFVVFFFKDTATTEIYTLSLHDALPISLVADTDLRAELDLDPEEERLALADPGVGHSAPSARLDRKSTRLNSSPANISHAVFCLTKTQSKTIGTPIASNRY